MRISVENERKLVNEILINIGVQEDHAKIITEATLAKVLDKINEIAENSK